MPTSNSGPTQIRVSLHSRLFPIPGLVEDKSFVFRRHFIFNEVLVSVDVQLHVPIAIPRGKNPWYPLDRR